MNERVPSIKKLIRVSDDGLAEHPLTVVSLRDVNLAMRKVIPMILCKQLYDHKKETDPSGGERYLNLIIDEAHNILSTQSTRESEAWRDYRLETFEEIVKEGRKFGVFLTIASQRPPRHLRNHHLPTTQLLPAPTGQQPRHPRHRKSCRLPRRRLIRIPPHPPHRHMRHRRCLRPSTDRRENR